MDISKVYQDMKSTLESHDQDLKKEKLKKIPLELSVLGVLRNENPENYELNSDSTIQKYHK